MIFRAGESCQEIAGLRATEEYICIDAPEFLVGKLHSYAFQMEVVDKTYQIEGFTPTLSMSNDHCNVKINLCYYESSGFSSDPAMGPLSSSILSKTIFRWKSHQGQINPSFE